ncbi:MAG: hypothetical protein WBW81_10670 [Methylocella sp.]
MSKIADANSAALRQLAEGFKKKRAMKFLFLTRIALIARNRPRALYQG